MFPEAVLIVCGLLFVALGLLLCANAMERIAEAIRPTPSGAEAAADE
jgi:hypothetical protein